MWSGNRLIPVEEIKSVSKIHPGDVLDAKKVRDTAAAVRHLYAMRGYPKASIVHEFQEVYLHQQGRWVRLRFKVNEGSHERATKIH